MMIKILVSACLIGERVRYNGEVKTDKNAIICFWQQQGRLVSFCPEVVAGLSVPRPPAEIVGGDGSSVLQDCARVMDIQGQDVTNYFLDGAKKALELVRSQKVKVAILKDGSPSCGNTYIYDGSFTQVKKPGSGVTAFCLEQKGVRVFNEYEVEKALAYLKEISRLITF